MCAVLIFRLATARVRLLLFVVRHRTPVEDIIVDVSTSVKLLQEIEAICFTYLSGETRSLIIINHKIIHRDKLPCF